MPNAPTLRHSVKPRLGKITVATRQCQSDLHQIGVRSVRAGNDMSRRLPACDPCRLSKLSCGHQKPVCSRCSRRGTSDECIYRDRPFKKRKTHNQLEDMRTSPQSAPAHLDVFAGSVNSSKKTRCYPNPGYLGPSSHTTFFDHLAGNSHHHVSISPQEPANDSSRSSGFVVTEERVEQGAALLGQARRSGQLSAWKSLTETWVKRGINLPLAEPFTVSCASVAHAAISQCGDEVSLDPESVQVTARTSRQLFMQTCKPLDIYVNDDIEAFCEHFCRKYARWETLGIFFVAVSRATIDITQFDGLYDSESERRALRRLAMRFSDVCLDIALSLDCLNDLQLILQYENFILHSLVDGDQSKFLNSFISSGRSRVYKPFLRPRNCSFHKLPGRIKS